MWQYNFQYKLVVKKYLISVPFLPLGGTGSKNGTKNEIMQAGCCNGSTDRWHWRQNKWFCLFHLDWNEAAQPSAGPGQGGWQQGLAGGTAVVVTAQSSAHTAPGSAVPPVLWPNPLVFPPARLSVNVTPELQHSKCPKFGIICRIWTLGLGCLFPPMEEKQTNKRIAINQHLLLAWLAVPHRERCLSLDFEFCFLGLRTSWKKRSQILPLGTFYQIQCFFQLGQNERLIQPGEEKAPRSSRTFQCLKELHESWTGTFGKGLEWQDSRKGFALPEGRITESQTL